MSAKKPTAHEALSELRRAIDRLDYTADGFTMDVIESVLRDVRRMIDARVNVLPRPRVKP